MIEAVAAQRAIAAGRPGADVLNRPPSSGSLHIECVEVDEMLRRHNSMRVMAGGARGLLLDDVEPMTAVLTQTVRGAEALITKNAFTTMALVAKSIAATVFGILIG